jgi:curved DNA-binding protein CbpA
METNDASNHYLVLGIDESAQAGTVKEAYRTLILRHHPDKSGTSDIDLVDCIQKAYEVLRDPSRRKEYDEELRLTRQRQQSRLESAIVLGLSDCTREEDEEGSTVMVYHCRCGTCLDTSPLLDEEERTPDEEVDDGLLDCPGCSLIYDIRSLHG